MTVCILERWTRNVERLIRGMINDIIYIIHGIMNLRSRRNATRSVFTAASLGSNVLLRYVTCSYVPVLTYAFATHSNVGTSSQNQYILLVH